MVRVFPPLGDGIELVVDPATILGQKEPLNLPGLFAPHVQCLLPLGDGTLMPFDQGIQKRLTIVFRVQHGNVPAVRRAQRIRAIIFVVRHARWIHAVRRWDVGQCVLV